MGNNTTRPFSSLTHWFALVFILATGCEFSDLTTNEDPNDPVTEISIFPKVISLIPAQRQAFTVMILTQSGDTVVSPVDWSATGGDVNGSGVYTAGSAVGNFAVIVTLRDDSTIADTADVLIEATLVPVASVTINPNFASLVPGESAQLNAVLRDAQGNLLTGREVSWTSGNTGVATVNVTGRVTAVDPGSTTIEATSENITGAATVTVSSGPSGDPIPGLATWEARMLEGGARFCAEPILPPSPNCCANEQSVWYYDGIKVFYQIAEYTGDDQWKACAQRVVDVYRPWTFDPAPGLPYGFEVFSQGLRMHFEDTGDQVSRDAVSALAFESPFAHLNLGNNLRERAYMIEALIDEYLISAQLPPGYANFITESIAELAQSVDHPQGQAFMVGLIAEAIIRHHEEVDQQDARVLPAVQTAMDKLWDSCVIGVRQPGRGDCGSWGPDVYQLVAPAFAWLYHMGLTQYGPRGDQLFETSAEDSFFSSGKHFSQQFHWSFDYVRWRR